MCKTYDYARPKWLTFNATFRKNSSAKLHNKKCRTYAHCWNLELPLANVLQPGSHRQRACRCKTADSDLAVALGVLILDTALTLCQNLGINIGYIPKLLSIFPAATWVSLRPKKCQTIHRVVEHDGFLVTIKRYYVVFLLHCDIKLKFENDINADIVLVNNS